VMKAQPMIDFPPIPVLVLDEGQAANLDALALTVAAFGRGRFNLAYAHHRSSLRRMAAQLAVGVVVVDVDQDPDPKDLLADVVELGFPVVVLTDGRNDAIFDHAQSVGAAACLPTSSPAHEIVSNLELAATSGTPPWDATDGGW